jgi:hypothetical protein
MDVNIKVGLLGRTVRPATWGDVVTNVLEALLAVVIAYRLMPTIAKTTVLSERTGILFSIAFGLIALSHVYHAVQIARGLRKPEVTA